MARPRIEIPPGLFRTGTEYQSMLRFWAGHCVRWLNGRLRVIGGWSALNTGLTGVARDIHTWVDNSANGRAAVGTESNLYVITTSGALTDITPIAYTSQSADDSTWVIDNAGQILLGVNDAEGIIYVWQPGDTVASPLTNAPTADAVAVTNEGIPVALGSAGNPRQISWCDRDDFTAWTATPTNLAGDLPVQASGTLQNGKRIRAGLLLWTTGDLHLMRYVGRPDIYGVAAVAGGEGSGAVSRHCMVVVNDIAYWLGQDAFYVCNGGSFVSKLPCEIWDDIFAPNTNTDPARIVGMNKAYRHKVRAVHVSKFNEVWWHYPKGASTENNAVAVYNYLEKWWAHHDIARTCGIEEKNGFTEPLMVGGQTVWKHEIGTSRSAVPTPYGRTGPYELGDGENVMHVRNIVPDEATAGNVDVYFHTRLYPNADETTHGPYSAANPSNARFTARQVSMEFREAQSSDWRVGAYRVDMREGGKR